METHAVSAARVASSFTVSKMCQKWDDWAMHSAMRDSAAIRAEPAGPQPSRGRRLNRSRMTGMRGDPCLHAPPRATPDGQLQERPLLVMEQSRRRPS